MISLRNVTYEYQDSGYQKVRALDELTLEIAEGESAAILGSNGSGKSTLLKLMNGLIFAGKGEYIWKGAPITPRRMEQEEFAKSFHQQMGFVFQNPDTQLFCSSVEEEIAFGPVQMGLPQEEVERRVEDCLRLFGLTALRRRAPYHLSGGEKRKVSVACILSMNPSVLLLDEPFAGLDTATAALLEELLKEFHRAGKTLILSTHNEQLAGRLCGRQIRLTEG